MEVSQHFCPSLKLSWLFAGGGKRTFFLLKHKNKINIKIILHYHYKKIKININGRNFKQAKIVFRKLSRVLFIVLFAISCTKQKKSLMVRKPKRSHRAYKEILSI